MKKSTVIYQTGQHQWVAVAHKPEANHLSGANEYLITDGATALLTYPGRSEICSIAFAAMAKKFNPLDIGVDVSAEQLPDVNSSLTLKLDFNPDLKCHLTCLWTSFVPNFSVTEQAFIEISDKILAIVVGQLHLQIVPVHYSHSFGNFHLYDEAARMFFSGGIGSAILPQKQNSLFVQDFDRHIRHAEDFYRRWMWSPQAKQQWCERIATMNIDMLCPQHGPIYQGEDVERFINWFAELPVDSQSPRPMEYRPRQFSGKPAYFPTLPYASNLMQY